MPSGIHIFLIEYSDDWSAFTCSNVFSEAVSGVDGRFVSYLYVSSDCRTIYCREPPAKGLRKYDGVRTV